MEDKSKELLKNEREMKRLVARMDAESSALNKILKVLEPSVEGADTIQQKNEDKKENNNYPIK